MTEKRFAEVCVCLATILNNLYLQGGKKVDKDHLEGLIAARKLAVHRERFCAYVHNHEVRRIMGVCYLLGKLWGFATGDFLVRREAVVYSSAQYPRQFVVFNSIPGKPQFVGPNPGQLRSFWSEAVDAHGKWLKAAQVFFDEAAKRSDAWREGDRVHKFEPDFGFSLRWVRTERDLRTLVQRRPKTSQAFVEEFAPKLWPRPT